MAQEPLSASTRGAEIRQTLQTRLISEPLRTKIDADLASRDVVIAEGAVAAVPTRYEVIIELNLNNPAGRVESREAVLQILRDILGPDAATALARNRPDSIHPY